MAGDGGRQSRSLKEQLFDDASRFSFLQAVRLLEEIRRGSTPPGEGVSPRHEIVLFRHAIRFDFPETDVENIVQASTPDQPPHMTVNVLGLTGASGPLPHHITEQVLDRTLRGDHASRDFLDVFNHRLISLLYRARKKYRPALDPRGPDRGRVATVLFALMGLGTRHLANRLGIRDRTLLSYAGFLASQTRSAAGLERLIEHCFEFPAKLVPFRGRWHDLQEDDQTRIGATGQNQLLGKGAVLGRRVWDQAAGAEIRIGPLPFDRFQSFLPSGHAFSPLVAVVRFYMGEETGFTFRLLVAKKEIPQTQLSRNGTAFLGWTSWLTSTSGAAGSQPAESQAESQDPGGLRARRSTDDQVTFVGRR